MRRGSRQRNHNSSPALKCSRATSTESPSMKLGNDPFDVALLPELRLLCKASCTTGCNSPTTLHKVLTFIALFRDRSGIDTAFCVYVRKKVDIGGVAAIPVIVPAGETPARSSDGELLMALCKSGNKSGHPPRSRCSSDMIARKTRRSFCRDDQVHRYFRDSMEVCSDAAHANPW